MTRLGPCRVFTPARRHEIADEFCAGEWIADIAVPTSEYFQASAERAIEDAIRWAINNGWKPKKMRPRSCNRRAKITRHA